MLRLILRGAPNSQGATSFQQLALLSQFVAVNIIRLTIPSMHVRILVLICGSGAGVGVGVCACVSCRVLPGVADDVDACIDGPALDGIRVAPNSLIHVLA